MTVFELAVPCRLVSLHLRVGPESGTTTLEDLVARAVLAGRATAGDLALLFALPKSIVVDVVGTLWSKGYVTVDFDNGTIELSDDAREMLTRNQSLSGSGAESQTRKFLFEPITGLVLPDQVSAFRPYEGSAQLPLRHGITETDIPQPALLRAVQAAIRRDRRQSFRANVLDVSFGNPILREPTVVRWVHLRVTASHDTQNNRISVAVSDDDDEAASGSIEVRVVDSLWSADACQRLSTYIAELAEREPDLPFVQHLRGRAEVTLRPAERVDKLLNRMREKVAELPATPPNQVGEAHRVLAGMARTLSERIATAAQARAEVTPVTRAEGHDWAVGELIESARSQLVIVAPSLSPQALNDFFPALRDALARGVHVVVLWGRKGDDRLPQRARTALDDLEYRYAGRVLVARRSARTDACFIVQDDHRALVGSHSPLGADPIGANEVSALIEPAAEGAHPPHAVVDLLLWARETFPHWQQGRRIKLHRHEFDHDDRPETIGPVPADVPIPVRPPDPVEDAQKKLWVDSWAEHHAALAAAKDELTKLAPTVEVILDGGHREVLWHGLRTARRRLLIADDRIDLEIANEAMAKTIRERRQDGAVVRLVHPAPRRTGNEPAPFAELGSGRGRVSVRLGAANGRVVVADDEVLVGSFSALGSRDDRLRAAANRRSQVGLHIMGEAIAAGIMAVNGVSTEQQAQPVRSTPAVRTKVAGTAALPLLIEAESAPSDAEFGKLVVRRLREVDEPWSVLDAWLMKAVPAQRLRVAAAAMLCAGVSADRAGELRWVRWLVRDAWERRAFVEAALLAERLPDRSDGLDAAATLAAAIDIGPLGEIASDAALELIDKKPDAQSAGSAGALAEMLRWAGGEGPEALSVLLEALPAAWRTLADVVRGHFTRTHVAVSLAAYRRELRRATSQMDLDETLRGLVVDIDKLACLRGRFDFNTGQVLHDRMFVSGGLLDVVRRAAVGDATERAALRDRLPEHVRDHLDGLIAEANVPPMEWGHHGQFLRNVEKMVRMMQQVIAEETVSTMAPQDRQLIEGSADLARHLAAEWGKLFSEAKSVAEPYGEPLLGLMDILNPMVEWARHE
ncbi:MAG TPA: hypothetical protein VGP26_31605 [Actinophytocola sp.]|jgi:sugar-specific transcriptional regulator TrmB|nr:hypothetical protein [Actinophytocola sp.]